MIIDAPLITILIPATRPETISRAIESLLFQSEKRIKIIVGDNTINADVIEQCGNKYADDRIHFLHSHPITGGNAIKNGAFLATQVDTKYFKFLFDDDFLCYHSIEQLVAHCEQGYGHVFHGRFRFDSSGGIQIPESIFEQNKNISLTHAELLRIFALTGKNFIGEHSFCATDSTLLPDAMRQNIGGYPIRYLGDVAMHINVSKHTTTAGIGLPLGGFNVGPSQQSSVNSPLRIWGVIEWELISRYASDAGVLSSADVETAKNTISNLYTGHGKQFSPLLDRASLVKNSVKFSLNEEFDSFYQEILSQFTDAT